MFIVEAEALGQNIYLKEDHLAKLDNPIAYKATNDPDTLYHHKAMKQPDKKKFQEAMVKEVNDHTKHKHWRPILKKEIPAKVQILPAVWAMKRKRRIATRKVYKWKA